VRRKKDKRKTNFMFQIFGKSRKAQSRRKEKPEGIRESEQISLNSCFNSGINTK
jgi:hypothetical protein